MTKLNNHFKGAIFDLDGVITQTAKVHFKAWKKTFEDFLKKKQGDSYKEFTRENDYLPYVDGKPRYQGVKSFLESRGIDLPYGDPDDNPDQDTVCGIGNRKNELLHKIIKEEGIKIYDSSVRFIKKLIDQGIKVGVASSSKNCKFILEATGLIDLFGTVVGGIRSRELHLKGKPHPDIFVTASKEMGLNPAECIMFEDAISGVTAGRRGHFALVVGVARADNQEDLSKFGADIVVEDLEELTDDKLHEWFNDTILKDCWKLSYKHFDENEEKLRETLTTTGNGYFGTRGCFVGVKQNDDVHYPGTYIAGLFNKIPTEVHGRTIYNNDFVNCPNWLLIQLIIDDDEPFNLLESEILNYNHELDMKRGVNTRKIRAKDNKGRITRIVTETISSMDNPHLGFVRYRVTPENYSGKITLKSTLDGDIINDGVPRYRKLNQKHLEPIDIGERSNCVYLTTRTNASHIKIYMNARTTLYKQGQNIGIKPKIKKDKSFISQLYTIEADKGTEYHLEKFVTIYTSKDLDVEDSEEISKTSLEGVEDYDSELEKHKRMWMDLWEKADIEISGDRFTQKIIRLHIYHLLTTASVHNKDIDFGMPARGLHGEAYRGHIFWDEIYIVPFFNLHFPETAKSFLLYRYRRLGAAREYTREHGYAGAMYPWQTADDGKEETQEIHYNPKSGKWDPDLSQRQRHVSIAIAYNTWEYFYVTRDLDFLHKYGAEMMLEITRFWASIVKYDPKDQRYHIEGVMGPDEFHEKYPDADLENGGLKDNAYTNIMVAWLMHKTIETLEYLPDEVLLEVKKKTGFELEEIEKWKEIVDKMNVVITDDEIISQFDGYMDLKELDWDYYKIKYEDIHRMDRILKAEGDTPDLYKVAKQADTLMIYYLLSPGQVYHILNLMGYKFKSKELELMKKNYDYYIERTSHGSTLSYVVHSAILTYFPDHEGYSYWDWYEKTLNSDLYDIQGGTTLEGIHTGVMGGTIDIIYKSFAGINLFKDKISIEPDLPDHWKRVRFKIKFHGKWFQIDIDRNKIIVNNEKQKDLYIEHCGKDYNLVEGKLEIEYTDRNTC